MSTFGVYYSTTMIKRNQIEGHIRTALGRSRIVALLGPRQCGKTTVARIMANTLGPATFFDLENPIKRLNGIPTFWKVRFCSGNFHPGMRISRNAQNNALYAGSL